MSELKQHLGLFQTTMYGVGLILGAGIYALIGNAAGIAGNSVWMSFILAAFAAIFTGLSYAELSSMYPKAAAEYSFIKNAFSNNFIAFLVGWLTLFVAIISAAAISLGFAGYFIQIFQIPIILVAILIIVILSLVNFFGIRESSSMNVVFTVIEAVGLIIVIWAGFTTNSTNLNYFEMSHGFSGIFSAFALVFFAYVGFENIVNVAEEVKNPKKVLPRAIILAVAVTAVIYILVAVSAVRVLSWQDLSNSTAPLADVIRKSLGNQWGFGILIIALFATTNTILMMLVSGSRILYGIARDKALPLFFSRVHEKRKTPWVGVIVIGALSACFVFVGDIGIVADISVFSIIMVFVLVNLSLIWLRYKSTNVVREFKSPINVGKFPVLAVLGIVTPIIGVIHLSAFVIIMGFTVVGSGALFYFIYNRIFSKRKQIM